MAKSNVKVWDPLVRIGHWTLVAAFFAAYFSEDDLMSVHVWAGYVVVAYLIVRIVWGLIGSRYARFTQFIYPPSKIIAYLKQLASGKAQHYVGHNPAGGAMVLALLLSLTVTTITGLKLYAVEDNKGPFAISVEQNAAQNTHLSEVSVSLSVDQKSDDDESEEQENNRDVEKPGEAFWEELHELFANLTLFLVFLHIVGVVVSSRIDKEKLIKAMLTGEKNVDDTYQ